jgi:LuxR family maltose regulon positive regulatory protein
VLEDESAAESLAEVRGSNLFVTTLDERGGVEWLRYHNLFAELLERELRARSPELVPTLHRRAAEWFAGSGMHEEAITHASLGGDGRRAAALLWDCWDALMAQWRFVTVRRLIAEMPADRGELAGFCDALDTVCWALEGADPRLIMERLDALERFRDAPGVAPIIDRSRVSPLYGDIGRAVSDGWAAWERHPDTAFRTETSGQFGQVLWFAGDAARAREIIEPYLGELRRPAARTWAFGTLALIAADEGDVELAERYGREAANAIKLPTGAGAREAHFGRTALAEALRVGGRLGEAAEELAQAARLTGKSPTSFMHAFTLVFEAQLALTQRDHGRAREKAAAARAILGRYPDAGIVADRLAAVEAALTNGSDRPLEGSEPTAGELRVLALLATDLTVKQIAEHLYLSVKTVGAHRRRLYRRLGVTTRQDAVEVARQRGLLPPTAG